LKLEKGDQPKSTQESSCLKNRPVANQNVIFSNDLVVKKIPFNFVDLSGTF
jgi:hypothetical protein